LLGRLREEVKCVSGTAIVRLLVCAIDCVWCVPQSGRTHTSQRWGKLFALHLPHADAVVRAAHAAHPLIVSLVPSGASASGQPAPALAKTTRAWGRSDARAH
jgi:hypothetical protein